MPTKQPKTRKRSGSVGEAPASAGRSFFPWIILGAGALAIAALVMLRPAGSRSDAKPLVAAEEGGAGSGSHSRISTLPAAPGSKDPAGAVFSPGAPKAAPSPTPASEGPPEPETNAKIDHIVDDFRGYRKTLDGYKLEGVEQTNDGIALTRSGDANSSESDGFRRGVIESPVLPFNHPSNAVQPIWRAKVPGSETALRVELALSADGQNWSKWYQIEPTGDDISPTYPDGRPNPNYGAVSGNIVSNGLRLFPYMRYRATLSSTDANASPVLEEFKVTYLDSTEGQGYPANEEPQQAEQTQTDPRAASPSAAPAGAGTGAPPAPAGR